MIATCLGIFTFLLVLALAWAGRNNTGDGELSYLAERARRRKAERRTARGPQQ